MEDVVYARPRRLRERRRRQSHPPVTPVALCERPLPAWAMGDHAVQRGEEESMPLGCPRAHADLLRGTVNAALPASCFLLLR